MPRSLKAKSAAKDSSDRLGFGAKLWRFGSMFVQSEKFAGSHGGQLDDISIYGQDSNATTRRLAIMNLAIRGIEVTAMRDSAIFKRVAILQSVSGAKDNFHPDLRADYVLANPPFNDSDWFRKDDDLIKANANFGVRFLHQESHPRSTVQNIPRIHEHN